jgi:glutathione S-transferase
MPLTGDTATTPVLTLDGRSIGDSSWIIAAIERRWPRAPLHPEDEMQRRRARVAKAPKPTTGRCLEAAADRS